MARILVVDDEKSIRITLRAFLRDACYEVGVAEDAEEALGMLAAEDFDVVLSDIIMPRITGMFLLQAIKETSPHVRVILMTGERTPETVSEAVRAGAFDCLFKPIGKEQVLKTVANAVKILDDERRRLAEDYQETLEQLVEERIAALREIEDQRPGFDRKKMMATSTGFSSVQERVGLLSGVLRIETSPEHGTPILAEWPLTVPTIHEDMAL